MYNKSNDSNFYKIGLYIRLSREDGDDLESESISNQRSLLAGYLKANNLTSAGEYIDDGYSGGNFNRPSFQRLIRDIENGLINCVITKDLSRLGRDYIDTGRYVERYFPENNIRYIAVNDDIDTFKETSGSDMMPFKLSMNDMYAKDISKKVRSHLFAMKKEGKFCGSFPAYGYIRDPSDKHKLIIDPKIAPIVKQIFSLYISGYGTGAIADLLTKKEYPTPIMLTNSEKRLQNSDHPEIWKKNTINEILKNPLYTGVLIQHKTQNVSYKTKKRRSVPKNEWCIIENAHEAIIDKETFNIARSIRDKSNNYNSCRRNVDYLLSGLVYCKDCGARMAISYDKKRERITMNCSTYRKFSKYKFCFSHYINYNKLEKTIYTKIAELTNQYINDKNTFQKVITQEFLNPKDELNKKISSLKNEIDKLLKKQDTIYDDKYNGIISKDTYLRLYSNTEKDIKKINEKLAKKTKELSSISKNQNTYADYPKIINDFLNMKNPTKEMLNKIIDKIYIASDKKIEIIYRIKETNKV